MIEEIFKDIKEIQKLDNIPERIIIATTIENDTLIQDQLNTLMLLEGIMTRIEFWSWDYISNNMFLFNSLVNKYYPFRNSFIELASIEVLNKSIYKKSTDSNRLFEFQNIKGRNQLPIFDLSFINNTGNTVLLNSIDVYSRYLPIAKAGRYEKPSGILKVTKKFFVDLNTPAEFGEHSKYSIELDDPIYIYPKSPFRIQIQAKEAIVGYMKVRFAFNFNQGSISVDTPELFFNAVESISGRVIPI